MSESLQSINTAVKEKGLDTTIEVKSFGAIFEESRDLICPINDELLIQKKKSVILDGMMSPILIPEELPEYSVHKDDTPIEKWITSSSSLKWQKNMNRMKQLLFHKGELISTCNSPHFSSSREKYEGIAKRMKREDYTSPMTMKWQKINEEEVKDATDDYSLYDYIFQKRFGLDCTELMLLRFPCNYKTSHGIVEVSDKHIGYHGNHGELWVFENKDIVEIKQTSLSAIELHTLTKKMVCSCIVKAITITCLLSDLLSIAKEENEKERTIKEKSNHNVQDQSKRKQCEEYISRQLSTIQSNVCITDLYLSIPIDQLLSQYILSTHFYATLLSKGNDYSIHVGSWCERNGTCCVEQRRHINSQHVYEIMKKQISCTIKQYQCLIIHQTENKSCTLTIQYSISKIPFCDPLQFVLFWYIKSIDAEHVRIRVSCRIENKLSVLTGMANNFIQREAQTVCDRWVEIIKEKEAYTVPTTVSIVSKPTVGDSFHYFWSVCSFILLSCFCCFVYMFTESIVC